MKKRFVLINDEVRENLINEIRSCKIQPPFVHVDLYTYTRRSGRLHRLYHAWINEISEYTGYSHDEVHELMKAEFLQKRVVEVAGRHIETSSSTTELSSSEFIEYLEKVQMFCATEIGLSLYFPGD